MPYDRLKKLLEELIEKGMVQCEEQGKAKIFRLTSQGFKIHEELKKVRKILQDYGILK
jgi:predicted transcriptional regulator